MNYEKELKEHFEKLESIIPQEEIVILIKSGRFKIHEVMNYLNLTAKNRLEDMNFDLFDYISEDDFEDYLRSIPGINIETEEIKYVSFRSVGDAIKDFIDTVSKDNC